MTTSLMYGKPGMFRSGPKQLFLICICVCSSVLFYFLCRTIDKKNPALDINEMIKDRRNIDLVFIGGSTHSGTSLIRAMLDSHQEIYCGYETWLMRTILGGLERWREFNQKHFLVNAGVYPEALDDAIAQFMLEVILGHCPTSKLCCYKDTYILTYAEYIHRLFKNAKFIHMVRDPRAVVYSELSQKDPNNVNNVTSYWMNFQKWDEDNLIILDKCADLGKKYCLLVKYEQLILKPVAQTKRIFEFLGIPWSDEVLHHERHINKSLILRSEEYVSEDLFKPLHLNGLKSWFGNLPKEIEENLGQNGIGQLVYFDYDRKEHTPNYGRPDEFMMKRINK
uniref:protein-tyrosine sulfotransferase A-like isoform X1 n=1 Tax=Styela clava TaxID=7725 RepID=UPI00193AD7B4|nr:protein-tyrosine sulfotransferase A-like isoform X1 [Styela clava]